ncbi:MAG: lipid-A-disaccharide synthase [Acidobacteriaceae bacterium]|nr:lipid-A-disaccharide synthase [Acidobacteriaceae bacterium]
MRLLISAGEASGEMYGAQLIDALRRRDPQLDCFGVGGGSMRAAGCDLVVDAKELSVVGITEILPRVPKIYSEFRKLVREIDARKPDAAIVIDSPAFNFRVAREAHRRGIPVIYYVCPQLWAWRERRVRFFRWWVTQALVIFPFEEQWYRDRGVDAEFVGHPLADVAAPTISRIDFAGRYGLDPSKQWIALLPGSRRKEVEMNLPAMLKAAASVHESGNYEFLLAKAPTFDQAWFGATVQRFIDSPRPAQNAGKSGPPTIRVTDDARATLVHSRAAVVASGTATVEAAMMGTPIVVVYRVTPLTWTLGRPLVKVPHFAMVNLIAEREVVPELIQADFTAENVAAKLLCIIPDGPAREKMLEELAEVRARLKAGGERPAAERAGGAVMRLLRQPCEPAAHKV